MADLKLCTKKFWSKFLLFFYVTFFELKKNSRRWMRFAKRDPAYFQSLFEFWAKFDSTIPHYVWRSRLNPLSKCCCENSDTFTISGIPSIALFNQDNMLRRNNIPFIDAQQWLKDNQVDSAGLRKRVVFLFFDSNLLFHLFPSLCNITRCPK